MKTLKDFKKRVERFEHYEHGDKKVIYHPESTQKFKYYECFYCGSLVKRVYTKKAANDFLESVTVL